MSSDSPPPPPPPERSRSNSTSQPAAVTEADESSCISSTSNTNATTVTSKTDATDFSNSMKSHIEIHPQNASLTSNSNNHHQYIKRPLNAYMIWTVEQRQKIQKAPRQKMNEVSRAMGEVWKKMTDAEKAPYFEQAKKYSDEHKQALKDNPNLAYVPSRKKMRLSLKNGNNGDRNHSTSSPSSMGDISDIAESPALSNNSTRGNSFAPMSPTILHQNHRNSQGQITMVPRISYYQPISGGDNNSLENTTVRLIPAPNNGNRTMLPPNQAGGMIQVYDPNTYTIMPQNNGGAPQFLQPQLPQQRTQLVAAPATTAAGPGAAGSAAGAQANSVDAYLSSNQIRERYYAALCQPQFPNVFEAPSKLREANYYYDLHLQLHKKPL